MNSSESTISEPELKKGFCAFLDILGFTEYVKKNKGNNEAFRAALAALKAARSTLDNPVKLKLIKVKSFSDNVFISLNFRNDLFLLTSLFEFICRYQSELVWHGHLVRGGVSLGEIHVDDDMIYGMALIDAYEMESNKAEYPAVMVCESIVEAARRAQLVEASSCWSYQSNDWYFILADGKHYLNYLKSAFVFFTDKEDLYGNFLDIHFLRKHKELILHNLKEFEPGTRTHKKYLFLADYHNAFCEQCKHREEYNPDLLINLPANEVNFIKKKGFFSWHLREQPVPQ
ncbi:hypothetical protein [Pseudomonas amygdali]|uniref:hypothetical protein n=1 Tax=Pseudomonas amygdali TaxID=47877 RepID=UPI00037086C5|nr:hypothetical protein [Pseudomonas amygdali]KEZ26825.1 hypothetical protein A3SK_0113620 [Pseudomonas amygdali pv. tabaci str. 6605]BCS42990.1 hypothetical protein Pta6605_13210 [Pseudomonas amygdali pv. tabaci]